MGLSPKEIMFYKCSYFRAHKLGLQETASLKGRHSSVTKPTVTLDVLNK